MSGFAGFPNMPSFPGVGAGSPFGNQFNPGDFQFTGQNESLEMFQGTDPSGMGPSQLEASLFGGMGGPAPSPQFGQGWQQPHTGPAIDAESFGYNQPGPGQPYQRMEGGIKYTMSIEQMNNKIEQANRDSGRMGGAGTELMQALMADMQNTMASEQFRVDAANKLAAMGLQLGR